MTHAGAAGDGSSDGARVPTRTLTKVSPMIFLFSSGLVVMFRVLLMRLRGVLSSSEMGRVVVPL